MPADDAPVLIALTPVRNEAWILERNLRATATWADHIVVVDQVSDDGSQAIARAHPKVTLVENPDPALDEGGRQGMLLDAARRLAPDRRRVLVALDADEALTANLAGSAEWARVRSAAPGTVFFFDWVNVAPDGARAWLHPEKVPFGFVDDGRPPGHERVHNRRVPERPGDAALVFDEVKVLHLQYTDWARMRSKQRWYQCWERVHHPRKRPITLYRQYHHMDAAVAHTRPMRPEWTAGYERLGIDLLSAREAPPYFYDREVLGFLHRHGTAPFRKLNVWDVDWPAVSASLGHATNGELADPRSAFDRAVHAWLARTQPASHRTPVRAVQKLLQLAGW